MFIKFYIGIEVKSLVLKQVHFVESLFSLLSYDKNSVVLIINIQEDFKEEYIRFFSHSKKQVIANFPYSKYSSEIAFHDNFSQEQLYLKLLNVIKLTLKEFCKKYENFDINKIEETYNTIVKNKFSLKIQLKTSIKKWKDKKMETRILVDTSSLIFFRISIEIYINDIKIDDIFLLNARPIFDKLFDVFHKLVINSDYIYINDRYRDSDFRINVENGVVEKFLSEKPVYGNIRGIELIDYDTFKPDYIPVQNL